MKKNIISRFIIGVKKGIFTSTLPNHIIQLNNNPIIRIIRVLGGISMLSILTHRLDYLGEGSLYFYVLILCNILSLIFSLYLIYITYHRIKYMIKILKSDKLDVRNSPLDKFASIAAKIALCSKGFCETVAPISIIFGGMAGADEIRKAKGLEPIFIPKIADLVLSDNETSNEFKKMRAEEASLVQNNKELNAYKDESKMIDTLEKNGIVSKNDCAIWRNQIKRNESMCQENSKKINSKILESLDKINEMRNNK